MAGAEVDQNQREATQNAEYYAKMRMRRDAQGIAAHILEPSITYVVGVEPYLWAYLNTFAVSGRGPTDFETSPITAAMIERSQGSMLAGAERGKVEVIEARIATLKAEATYVSAMQKQTRIMAGERVDYTDEEMDAIIKVTAWQEQKDGIVEMATDGASTLMNRVVDLDTQITELEHRRAEVSAKPQVMDEAKWERLDELTEMQLAALKPAVRADYKKLQDKLDAGERLTGREMAFLDRTESRMDKWLEDEGHYDEYVDLRDEAGSEAMGDRQFTKAVGDKLEALRKERAFVDRQVQMKLKDNEPAKQWYEAFKAFRGMADLIATTHQWVQNWADIHAGAVDGFTQTRWTESYRPSDMLALLSSDLGPYIEKAFAAIAAVGSGAGVLGTDGEVHKKTVNPADGSFGAATLPANVKEIPIKNVMRSDGSTGADLEGFIDGIRGFVALGKDTKDPLYAYVGAQVAKMLSETSLLSGWWCVERDANGDIVYSDATGKNKSANPSSDVYMIAGGVAGNGSLLETYLNDFGKLTRTRHRMMNEVGAAYPVGMQGLMNVLPDYLITPMISQADIIAIVGRNGDASLKKIFEKMPDTGRWGWLLGVFRAGQTYESFVSDPMIGAKGTRGMVEEVNGFIRNPVVLASFKKKIEGCLNRVDPTTVESQRFVMNVVLSLMYAIRTDKANPDAMHEVKSHYIASREGVKDTPSDWTEKEFIHVFVKVGILTEKQAQYVWHRLLKLEEQHVNPENMGMIKKKEVRNLVANGILIKKSKETIDAEKMARRRRQAANS